MAGLQAIKEAKLNGMWAAPNKAPISEGQVKSLIDLSSLARRLLPL